MVARSSGDRRPSTTEAQPLSADETYSGTRADRALRCLGIRLQGPLPKLLDNSSLWADTVSRGESAFVWVDMVASRDVVRQIAVRARTVIASAPGRDCGHGFGRCPPPPRAIEGETHQHELEVLMEDEELCESTPLVASPSCPSCPSHAGAAVGPTSGLRAWREWGVRPVTLRGMRRGNEGGSRVASVCEHRPRRRSREGLRAPFTSATGGTTGYPGAPPVANLGAHPLAEPSPGGASPLVSAAQIVCGVAG